MRWVERFAATAMLVGVCATSIAQQQSEYGKVDTFQPGKKYTCVPTADRKGWDCKDIGNAPKEAERKPAPPPPQPAPTPPQPASPPPAAPEPARSMTPIMPPAPSEKPTALPAYLRAQPASNAPSAPASPPPAPAPVAPPPVESKPPVPEAVAPPVAAPKPVPAPVETKPAPPPAPPAEPVSVPAPAPETVTKPAPPPAPARQAASTSSIRGNREFLALPSSGYVIELAHAASRADLASLRENLQLPSGDLYELHLSRDGGDWWALVWASFDSISAARAARNQLPTDAAINAGWPRQIAPLQNEARRRLEQ